MTWGWFQADRDELDTTTIKVFVAYGNDSGALSRFQREMRRQIREVDFYPTETFGIIPTFARWPIEASTVAGYRYRTAIFGRPFRPLNLGRLRSWIGRVVAPHELVIVAADTQSSNVLSLTASIADSGGGIEVANSLGALGEGLTEGVSDVARGGGEAARGLGDAARGLGDAVRSTGEGLQDLGSASRAVPGLTLAVVALLAGGVFLITSGALKFAPVKLGG